jgi:flavin reductase (DIM6/NTAB) family NADH-FMN oxidoreductase RutF
VVTTDSGHAMTVSAFASVSLDPPLVLFCAEKIARFHDAVLASGSWAVSILADDAEKAALVTIRPFLAAIMEVP